MRYFDSLPKSSREGLFFQQPGGFDKRTAKELLRGALGGLLYTPSIRADIAHTVLSQKVPQLSSMAICLEDSVGQGERAACVQNTERQLALLAEALETGALPPERLPLLFIRVRDQEMLEELAGLFVRYSRVLTGVILPKVVPGTLEQALAVVDEIAAQACDPFYAMPILEAQALACCDGRAAALRALCEVTDRHFGQILNIRIGATDLCGMYGIRRGVGAPVYNVAVAAQFIGDAVRVFGLQDRYTISGPVWEYYGGKAELQGLLREAALDLQNGLQGKTCIHPSQLLPVQAGYVVPWELWQDAQTIAEGDQGHVGVLPSAQRNKMNELRPHALWAQRVLRRAAVFGVYRQNTGCEDLLRAAGLGEQWQ